jgi:hypothetical protein
MFICDAFVKTFLVEEMLKNDLYQIQHPHLSSQHSAIQSNTLNGGHVPNHRISARQKQRLNANLRLHWCLIRRRPKEKSLCLLDFYCEIPKSTIHIATKLLKL